MSLIKSINQHIVSTEAKIKELQSALSENQNNISASLTLKTLNQHIVDLQAQLQQEKNLREKEVVVMRLKGEIAKFGSIPLSTLSSITHSFSNAISSLSQRIRKGEDKGGRISTEILKTIDLRLAGLQPGSTKLIITGRCSSDLFGYSLVEDSLGKTFDFLKSNNENELTDNLSSIGARSSNQMTKFLKALISNDLEAEVTWHSPNDEIIKWDGSLSAVTSLHSSLANIIHEAPVTVNITGKLEMSASKGKFEILGQDKLYYSGTFPKDLLSQVKIVRLGDLVKATLEKEKTINNTTGKEKTTYTLKYIESLDSPQNLPSGSGENKLPFT